MLVERRVADPAAIPTRVGAHGGYREGAGRKPVLDGAIKRTYVLTEYHLELIAQWQENHRSANASEALRQIIERSVR